MYYFRCQASVLELLMAKMAIDLQKQLSVRTLSLLRATNGAMKLLGGEYFAEEVVRFLQNLLTQLFLSPDPDFPNILPLLFAFL